MIFWFAVVVFVLVEGALLFAIIRYRARPDGPEPKQIHGHTALEIAWTLAPAWIVALIAVPAIEAIWEEAAPAAEGALVIQVTGHQWWWEYRYPEYGVITANELHLPVGRPVELQMTSADVIHSWWLPRFGGKRDLMAGRTNRLVFTPDSVGEFTGQCAEFCGVSHANMRMRATVTTQGEFDSWVASQTAEPTPLDSLTDLQRRGHELFMTARQPASNSCLACHAISGRSFGVLGPNLTHVGARSTLAGGLIPNDAENLASWLRDPSAIKPGTDMLKGDGSAVGMPTVGLTEDEITALAAYLQSLR
jgi:cytochrome c oxidase subunit 2